MRTVAALYIDPGGPYPRMAGVDCWDEQRDARGYPGPHPVVAHPPCGRWCRLAKFVEQQYGHRVGDDDGTFAAALAAVRAWGGVLEHPAFSLAWPAHGLIAPRSDARGWQLTLGGYWVCQIAQSAYGHAATKPTWLVAYRITPPRATRWHRPKGSFAIGSYSRKADGTVDRHDKRRVHDKRTAIGTPPAFAEYLVGIARSVGEA